MSNYEALKTDEDGMIMAVSADSAPSMTHGSPISFDRHVPPLLYFESRGYEVVTLGHAYRVNGVVDVWFNNRTVFSINKNNYTNYTAQSLQIQAAQNILDKATKKAAFKKRANGRETYQEFRNLKKTKGGGAEYYHWSNNKEVSDDSLYFIEVDSKIKIGRSADPARRLKELSTGSPFQPKLILAIPNKGHMEKILHRCFSQSKIKGEWFRQSAAIFQFIQFLKPQQR
jgi:hypothetical protein